MEHCWHRICCLMHEGLRGGTHSGNRWLGIMGAPLCVGKKEVRRSAQGKEWGLNPHCVLGTLKHFRCPLFNPHQIPDFVRQ